MATIVSSSVLSSTNIVNDVGVPAPTDAYGELIGGRHGWWVAAASRRGLSHIEQRQDRQDAFAIARVMPNRITATPWFVLALADGVGSARFARLGAARAVGALTQHIATAFNLNGTSAESLDAVKLLHNGVMVAIESVDAEVLHREADRRDFACTLLAAVGVVHDAQLRLAMFQVGDGLIACAHDDGRLEPLIDPGDEDEDGAIHVLTSRHLQDSMDDRRLRSITFPSFPRAIVITSDGIQRDLIPLRQGGPVLVQALRTIRPDCGAGIALWELIGYEKRGSLDDRTLVAAFHADSATNLTCTTTSNLPIGV